MKFPICLGFIIALAILPAVPLRAQVNKKMAKKSYNEAMRAMRRQNYPQAINKAIIAIQGPIKSKHRTKAIEAIGKGYMSFYGNSITEINNLKSEHKVFVGKPTLHGLNQVVFLYESLLKVVESVQVLSPELKAECGIDTETLIDYQPEVDLSRRVYNEKVDKYVRTEYDAGIEYMKKGTKTAAYLAYGHFSNVVEFQHDFEEVQTQRSEAKDKATYYIKIDSITVEDKTPFAPKLSNVIQRSINNSLARNRSDYAQFIKLVDEQNATRSPDLTIKVNLYGASVSIGKVNSHDETVSKEIGTTTEKVSSGKEEAEITKKVKVNVTVREFIQVRNMHMAASLDLINEASGALMIDKAKLNEHKKDEIGWWRYVKGDKRALSSYLEKEIEKDRPTFGTTQQLATDLASLLGRAIAIRSLDKINSLFPVGQ